MLPAPIDIQVARNPFEGTRTQGYAAEGQTLREMIAAQGLREDSSYGVVALVGGELVPERMLSHVRPRSGTSVVLRVIPRGGDTGKAILSIVIAIVAVVAAIPSGGLSLGMLAGEGGLAFAAVAAAGAMTIATSIQSIVAPPPSVPFSGSIATSQDSAALTGTRNSARLYGPMRTVLGEYRVYPDLLAKPFTERVGKDSVLRLLMCFGYGPLEITDIKIGERPIAELLPSSDYAVLPGWDDDPDLTIFRDDVTEDSSLQPSFTLEDQRVGTVRHTVATSAGPEEISIDLAFPAGLISFGTAGAPHAVTVRFTIEEREQGDVAWTNIATPTMGLEPDNGITEVSAGVFDFKLAERGSVTRGLRWTVPPGSTSDAIHEVRISRTTTTTPVSDDDAIASDARLLVIRTIKPHAASSIPNLAKIELRINASETGLSGVVDNLSAVCTSIVPKWDSLSESWGPTHANAAALGVSMHKTRNAAWLYAHTLRGPANSIPVADNRIDGPSISAWAGNLEGTGSYAISGTDGVARNLDAVIDYSSTVRRVLSDIAGAGRASLNIIDGKYGIVQDVPQTQVVQHFSPRNSSGFTGSKSFRKKPHGIRTHFINPANAYQRDERIVYDDGYSEDGNRAVALAFRGSTTPTTLISSSAGTSSAWRSNDSTLAGHEGYSLRQTVTDDDPFIYNHTDNLLGIDATTETFVRVRLRRVTTGDESWGGYCFHETGTNGFNAGRRAGPIAEPDWSKGWVDLVWDMSADSEWTGTVDRLRFDIVQGGTGGTVFDIESITVDDGTQPATEFGELSLWGVADPEQVYRDARYHIASNRLRPEVFTITADVEHVVCNRGDLVRVSHDIIGVGYGGARLTSTVSISTNWFGGAMDEEFYFHPSKSYACRIRKSDGVELLVPLQNQNGTSNVLTPLDGSIDQGGTAPAVGDMLLFGESDVESLECLVMRISPRNDLTALLELVEYNAAVYEPGSIPDHETNITLQSSPTLLAPIVPEIIGDPVSDEKALAYSSSGTPVPMILLNVTTPANTQGTYASTTHYHAQFRMKQDSVAVTDWMNSPRVEATGDTRISIGPVEEGEVYDVRVRSISDSAATASDWKYANDHTVIGLSTPPVAPTGLSLWGDAVRWDYPTKARDFAGFVVRYQSGSDATWATGVPLTENLITDNWVMIAGRIQPGSVTIMVRAVDYGGNESTTLSATRVVLDPDALTVLRHQDWTTAPVFDGDRTGCSYNATSGYLEANVESTELFWSGGDTATYWTGAATFWGVTIYKAMTYEENYQIYDEPDNASWPTNDELPGRVRFSELDIEGSSYEIDYAPLVAFDAVSGVSQYGSWKPWPGRRDLDTIEFPQWSDVYETSRTRIRIAGGTTQGKIKAGKIVTEALPRKYTETVNVGTGGTAVDLTGKRWRKITSVSVTATNTANTSQGAITGEAYDLDAAQTTTVPYELTGPTVKLFTNTGAAFAGTASVVIEGY